MNDAMRGVIITVASVALYFAVRLACCQLIDWVQNHRRRYIMKHVLWLTAGLALNAGLAIGTEIDNVGINHGIMWKEWLRLAAHSSIAAGLYPLWREHLRRQDKGAERHDAVT